MPGNRFISVPPREHDAYLVLGSLLLGKFLAQHHFVRAAGKIALVGPNHILGL